MTAFKHDAHSFKFEYNKSYAKYFQSYLDKSLIQLIDGFYIVLNTLYPLIKNIFDSISIQFDYSLESTESYFDISDDLLGSEGRLYPDQYKTVKKMVSLPNGMCQLATGSGKSEHMIWINQHCKVKSKLILANNNQVVHELRERFKKYGIHLTDTLIINPISFIQSNDSKRDDVIQFLKSVELIQIDELESVNSSIVKVLSMIDNYKFIYGYSASPDRVKGRDLSDPSILLDLDEITQNVIKLVGFSTCYASPIKPLQVNIIKYPLHAEHFPKWTHNNDNQGAIVIKQKLSQSNLFKDDAIFKVLESFILPNKQNILFIPYRFIEHGNKLFEHFQFSEYKILQWDGEKIRTNFLDYTPNLTGIKELTKQNAFDILIASSVADRGVDFRNLNDALLITHTQYNNVIQSIGRLSRESLDLKANIWLIENTQDNTPFYSIMHKSRVKKMKENFVSEFKIIDFSDQSSKSIPLSPVDNDGVFHIEG